MKLKSLILGSVAAAGLSTAGFAADLGVLTSLDVCDELGLSGLTISSDTNCLQISGNVKYEFYWGDYKNEPALGFVPLDDTILGGPGFITTLGAGGLAGSELDWRSKVSAWLKFVGTASSDFGTAKAVLKLNYQDRWDVQDEGVGPDGVSKPHADNGMVIDEAYVSVGDSTVIMAGKKSTIGVFSDATPFNYLGLFGVDEVDAGTLLEGDEDGFGGSVIQIVSDLGNGVSVGLGLENLDGFGTPAEVVANAGTLVGVVSYKGDAFAAHLTGFTGGILDGTTEFYGFHVGATGTFDAFKLRGALGYLYNDIIDDSKLHALLSAEGTFDLFTIAVAGEYVDGYGVSGGYGLGGSIGAAVTEGVKINLGARWYHDDTFDLNTTQVSAQIVADVAEGLAVTGELGGYFTDLAAPNDVIGYAGLGLAWNPGGDFKSSIKGEVNTNSAYKVSFKAEKAFN